MPPFILGKTRTLILEAVKASADCCSFMRTEMTKGVGFDKFWDDGGALEPDDAARILGDWVEKDLSLDKTGQYWAPRGTRDIGNWDVVMGAETAKEGPVRLPW